MDSIISTAGLCKKYKQGEIEINALKDVNIEICNKETVAIMGKSGSGKTTLLKTISGLLVPNDGKVFIDNIDLYSVHENERCDIRKNKIGFIFQSYELIPELTVDENIIFPALLNKSKPDKEYIDNLYEKLEIQDKKSRYPSELSGGEAQRVAIARALVNKPDILLCDEPTGNLDENTGNQVIQMLLEMNKTYGTTLIIVTHDKEIAGYTERIIKLVDGAIA